MDEYERMVEPGRAHQGVDALRRLIEGNKALHLDLHMLGWYVLHERAVGSPDMVWLHLPLSVLPRSLEDLG